MTSVRIGLAVLVVLDVVIVAILYYVTLSSPSVRTIETQEQLQPKLTTQSREESSIEMSSTISRIATVTEMDRAVLQRYVLDTFVGNKNLSIIENVSIEGGNRTKNTTGELCPETPPKLVGRMKVPVDGKSPSWDVIASQNPSVKGGSAAPKGCIPRFRVAVIIPIRDREEHLRALLYHLHPVLQRQQIDYTVYTVSLAGNGIFNRAKLMNAGFVEANRDRRYDCYIFHDVDLLIEDDTCLYWCTDEPREVAYHMNKFGYKPLSYGLGCRQANAPKVNKYFGGVAMVSHKLFLEVNGFSNIFWGWGGEDDDMYSRLWSKGHDIVNPYGRKCSFSMIKHEREGTNKVNPSRFVLLYHTTTRMKYEGLNTLRYKRLAMERKPMYTNVTVDIGEQSETMKQFMNLNFGKYKCGDAKMPWQ